MKKLLFLMQCMVAIMLHSSVSFADYERHGHGHHHGRHHGYRDGYGGGYEQNFDNNNYYSQQPVNGYYQSQPQPYYQPDGRSHQGLAGGVVGSVLGYEIANGNPLAAGLGAAAGAFLGNNMNGR